jgi:hypothetical protein
MVELMVCRELWPSDGKLHCALYEGDLKGGLLYWEPRRIRK